jgi:acetyl-CoA C-acetyltransferase
MRMDEAYRGPRDAQRRLETERYAHLVALDPRTPVLVGVGQVTLRADPNVALEERPEPVALMADALRAAADDAGAGAGSRLVTAAQSLRVMLPLSWSYVNPGLLVAQQLGITPRQYALTVIGGNSPQAVVNMSAQQIARGELDVVLITGAECIFTRVAARRAQGRPVLTWTVQDDHTPRPDVIGTERSPVTDTEAAAGLDRPLRVFPLFENALRASTGESIADHQRRVAGLWSGMSVVAATNPYAWTPQPRSPEEILAIGPSNRMVSFPYPKLMNANDRVDQGAALVLCSLEAARRAGVPDDRMVFPLSGADAHDHWFLSHRDDLRSSPALHVAAGRALALADVGVDDLAHIDLYSCFPCAVQIAAAEIGLTLSEPERLTVTGGLGFAGGPGNNYVTHSIATMAGRLRRDPGAVGLVTGLGWYLTKHAVGLWSTTPPASGFHHESPQHDVDVLPGRIAAEGFEGDAVIETYTVVYDRDRQPELGILALRTGDGRRAWGTTTDRDEMQQLTEEEGCGRKARVSAGGRTSLR